MTCPNLPLTRTLRPREFLHIAAGRQVWLRADRGTLWVTEDGVAADVELAAGDWRRFEPSTPLIVGTLGGPAVVSWTTAGRPGPWARWRARLAGALDRPDWRFEMA